MLGIIWNLVRCTIKLLKTLSSGTVIHSFIIVERIVRITISASKVLNNRDLTCSLTVGSLTFYFAVNSSEKITSPDGQLYRQWVLLCITSNIIISLNFGFIIGYQLFIVRRELFRESYESYSCTYEDILAILCSACRIICWRKKGGNLRLWSSKFCLFVWIVCYRRADM